MALTITGEAALPADRAAVWDKLNDPAVLKACIPGCQMLERTDENAFAATVKIKVGPIAATFKGSVNLSELDPPNGYRISGSGEGGIAGFAKGGARVVLEDVEEDRSRCILRYDVDANVGGKIAQLGGRLIDGVAKSTAQKFFSNLTELITAERDAAAGASPS